ncbi:MAG: hypothetical protein IKL44_03315 [Clostridia bacterium]|nr:hypothetical protein [Clostridia bacterium]MBR3593684.1 hypothetical protein [Clostridia bacterium]
MNKGNTVLEGELEKINAYSRRPLTADEVYVFSVTLCDNDIDRDHERFSDEALDKLAELFVGKTGICDHEMKSGNQKARVFSCHTEYTGEKTQDGREYKRLCARAYMIKSKSNEELIGEIDAGIKKEVSVGCNIGDRRCSVCGESRAVGCIHKPGRSYKTAEGYVLCHTVLDNPADAYEWSFVAVPAQRKAGVTKSYKEKETMTSAEILKALSSGEEVSLTDKDTDSLRKYLAEQNGLCELGRAYLAEKRAAILKSGIFGDISDTTAKSMVDRLNAAELDELYREAMKKSAPVCPQLKKASDTAENGGFMIR